MKQKIGVEMFDDDLSVLGILELTHATIRYMMLHESVRMDNYTNEKAREALNGIESAYGYFVLKRSKLLDEPKVNTRHLK